jgi:O-antigen ligase
LTIRQLPLTTLMLVALALLTSAQVGLGHVRFDAEALVASMLLLTAAMAAQLGMRMRSLGKQEILADAAAWGLIVALWANAVAVALGFAGFGVILGRLERVVASNQSVGLIGQANQLGVLAVLAMVSATYLRLRGLAARWFTVVTFVVATLVCAASGSRTAVLAFAAACVLYLFQARAAARPGEMLRKPLLLAAAVATFTAIQLGAALWILPLLQSDAINALRSGDAGRASLLWDGWRLWLAHPAFGVGYGNFAAARLFELSGPLRAAHADNAHNLLFQVLAEWGLVGALIVIPAFASLLWCVLSRRREPLVGLAQRFFGTFVVVLLLYSMFEFPLWMANFLLPFAVLAGALVQPSWRVPGRLTTRFRWMPWLGPVAVMASCGYAAWDYQRSQEMAQRMGLKIGAGQYTVSNVAFPEATRVAIGTLFPVHAEIMQARTLPLDGDFADYRLELARRALIAVPSGETVARYVAHSALALQFDKGLALMSSLRVRDVLVYNKAIEFLEIFSGADPRIGEIYRRAIADKPR